MAADDLPVLLSRAKQGDREAFRQLLTLRQRNLRMVVAAFAGSAEDIEPLLRTLAGDAFRALAQAPGDAAVFAWLRELAVTRVRARLAQPDAGSVQMDEFGRRHADACRELLAELPADLDFEALAAQGHRQLPQGARDLLTMRFAKGMPLAQVAESRGMSQDDVALAMSTACRRLDWRSGNAIPETIDPAVYRLVDAHCAGTLDDEPRVLLAVRMADEPDLAAQVERMRRAQVLAAGWCAPDIRIEDQDLAPRTQRHTTAGGQRKTAAQPPSTRRIAAPQPPPSSTRRIAAPRRGVDSERPAVRPARSEPRGMSSAVLIYLIGGVILVIGVVAAVMLHGKSRPNAPPVPPPAQASLPSAPPARAETTPPPAAQPVGPVATIALIWTHGAGTVPQATAAWGLRRLSQDHTGPLVRVRRTGDDSERDIGCDPTGLLDEAELRRFANGADVFVTKWLDQSGHGNDLTQPSADAQPRLVHDGIVEIQKGHAVLRFVKQRFQHLDCPGAIQAGTLFAAVRYDSSGGSPGSNGIMGSKSGDTSVVDAYYPIVQRDGKGFGEWWLGRHDGGDNLIFPTIADRLYLWTSMTDGAEQPTLTVWQDGIEKKSAKLDHPGVVAIGPTSVGGLYWNHGIADPLNGCLGEVIMLPPNQPAGVRDAVLANQRDYWGTP